MSNKTRPQIVIEKILNADEIEILEFDFTECFKLLRSIDEPVKIKPLTWLDETGAHCKNVRIYRAHTPLGASEIVHQHRAGKVFMACYFGGAEGDDVEYGAIGLAKLAAQQKYEELILDMLA